jgi:hypothetical protein
VSGNNSVPSPTNGEQSSRLVLPTGEAVESVPLAVGSFSIDDAIQMHLVDCIQCRKVTESGKPVAIGQKSGHCDTYWQLQLMRAQHEGSRNNIVAYTELGDEAPKGRPLE